MKQNEFYTFLFIVIKLNEVIIKFAFKRVFVKSFNRLINRIPNLRALKFNTKFTIICSNF